jgi:MOSC domain-containing protein YiiM
MEGAPDPMDRPWRSGIFKARAQGPVWLGRIHLAGDGQADRRAHGGPEKAVLAYAAQHYPLWREELGIPEMAYGAFGENFTIDGLDEETVCLGDIYQIGAARVQVSQPRYPCWKLARRWRRNDLVARVLRTGRSGWYFRVLDEGMVEAGLAVQRLERPNPEQTILRVGEATRRKLMEQV